MSVLKNVVGGVLLCYINEKQAHLFFLSVSFISRFIKFQGIMDLIIWEQKSIINFPLKYRAYQIVKNISRRH